ncbi:MAG: divalent-cation tolerance protein CutA [Myxococcus sp.]|nr:divalent-cation tolerance protein CutA [Myxococcus sp.]
MVLVTAPNEASAARLARTLVEERLVACANLVPKIRSIYRWKGKIEDAPEVLVLLKTRGPAVEALIARVKALHSYSVPEVLELPVNRAFAPYLDWVWEETERPIARRRRLTLV